MRGILIDPFKRTVTDVETDSSLDEIYSILDVGTITVVAFDREHVMFLDDEGLLKDKDEQAYFHLKGADQPFAGRGLIFADNYGDNRAATVSLEKVRDSVTFLDNANVQPEAYLGWTVTAW
jgi:hypothetical protein